MTGMILQKKKWVITSWVELHYLKMTKHLMLEIILCWKEQAIPASENSGDESARLDIETNSKQIHGSSSYNMETMVTGRCSLLWLCLVSPRKYLFCLKDGIKYVVP